MSIDQTTHSHEEEFSKDFLVTLAHEIRNPLAPLKNALELLHAAGDNPGMVSRALAVIDRQIALLSRLAESLVELNTQLFGRDELQLELSALTPLLVKVSGPDGR